MAVRSIFCRLVLSQNQSWRNLLRKATTTPGYRCCAGDGKKDSDLGDEGKVETSTSPSSLESEPKQSLPFTSASSSSSSPSSSSSSSSPEYISSRRQRRQEKLLEESEEVETEREKYFLDFINDSDKGSTTASEMAAQQRGGLHPDVVSDPSSLATSGKMDNTLKEFLAADTNMAANTTSGVRDGDHEQGKEVDFPSDRQEYVNWRQSQGNFAVRPTVDPETTTVLLFPGQGCQFVGMGNRLVNGYPRCREMYDVASSILGYDLLKLCLEGPQSELDRTAVCQPAVMVTSLAAVEWLQEENPEAVRKCIATAGFSVGEISALVFAGVIDFEEAVNLIKVRAEGMQQASEQTPSGMMTVFCTHKTKLGLAMQVAKDVCKHKHLIDDPVCQIANYLYPECKVIAGHDKALEFIASNTNDFGIRRTKRLPVSGAFHTPLMAPCVPAFVDALEKVEIKESLFPVYSNVKNKVYLKTSKGIKKLLKKHLTAAVKWEQILHDLYSRDKQSAKFPQTYEVGPGKQLGTFLRMVNLKAHRNYHNVEV